MSPEQRGCGLQRYLPSGASLTHTSTHGAVGAGPGRGGRAAIGGTAVRTPGEEKVQENGRSCQGARCNGTSGRGVGTFCGHEDILGLTRIYKKTKTYIYIYSHLLSLIVFIKPVCQKCLDSQFDFYTRQPMRSEHSAAH